MMSSRRQANWPKNDCTWGLANSTGIPPDQKLNYAVKLTYLPICIYIRYISNLPSFSSKCTNGPNKLELFCPWQGISTQCSVPLQLIMFIGQLQIKCSAVNMGLEDLVRCSVMSAKCYQCKMLLVQNAISVRCYQCKMLLVQNATSAKCYQCKMLLV